jgi:hypothetical protein
MTLVRKPFENLLELPASNKELQWGNPPIDDLFESFINPDSFKQADGESERKLTYDLISFFDTQALSNGNDTIDISPIPDVDTTHSEVDAEKSWRTALSFVEKHTTSPIPRIEQSRSSIYLQACGRSAASDSDLLRYQCAGTSIPLKIQRLLNRQSSPGWSAEPTESLFNTPLAVRKKNRAESSCVKPVRRGSASPNMMSTASYKTSTRQSLGWGRRLQAATATDGQVNFRTPSYGRLASPLPSAQVKSEAFSYNYDNDHPVRSPNGYQEDLDPTSPLSNAHGFAFFQPPNTPVASPTYEESRAASYAEPQPSFQLSSYPSTPYTVRAEHTNFIMTPPQTQPMNHGQWTHDAAIAVSSPDFAHINKAETWWEPSTQHADPTEVTCGAPVASNMLGLGISGIQGANLTSVMSNGGGIIRPSAVSIGAAPTLVTSPTPRAFSSHRGTTHLSASALSNSTSTYPMSPLQKHARQSQHMQEQSSRYLHHQRHHTVAAPLSVSTVTTSRSSHHGRTPSASPPPAARAHRRTKSSTNSRRKSSAVSPRQSSSSFVNFTPDDSRKILTGVAPSGSSKTKARREKEAADKRRKLGEAAKKAVLEAGGDLGTLEREGLLVLGSEL